MAQAYYKNLRLFGITKNFKKSVINPHCKKTVKYLADSEAAKIYDSCKISKRRFPA